VKASRIFVAGAALFITLVCWSLSSPINSHQDEKFHLASIWCADGFSDDCDYQGLSETGVKTVLIKANLCTPANTEETENKRLLVHRNSGDCKFEATENEPLQKMSVSPNFFYETDTQISAWIQPGHTPSIYYKALNLFDITNKEQSVIRFRVINSFLFASLIVMFLLVSSEKIRNNVLFAMLVTFIPHGLFYASSVSTSSWAYTGCSLSWAFFYVLLSQRLRFKWKTGLATLGWIVSSGAVISSRYDTMVFLAATNFAVLVLKLSSEKRRRNINLSILVAGTSVLALIAWMKIRGLQSLLRISATQSNNPTDLTIVFGNALKLFVATPLRILGLQAPDWGTMNLSISVFLVNLVFVACAVLAVIRRYQTRDIVALLPVFGFIFGIYLLHCYFRRDATTPFYLIRTSWSTDAFWPRYFIPYFPFIFGMIALNSKDFIAIFNDLKFRTSLFTVIAFTQTITLDDIGQTFRENPNWFWQHLPFGIQVLQLTGTLSFVFFLGVILELALKFENKKRLDYK